MHAATEGHVRSRQGGEKTDEAMSPEEKTAAAKSVVRRLNTFAVRLLVTTGKNVCLRRGRQSAVIVERK